MNLSHSYSALKLYDNCPLRYWHQRIAKTVTDPGSEASLYGERIHKSIELYLRDDVELPDELSKLKPTLLVLRQAAYTKLVAEEEVTLTRDFKLTGWWDDDAWFRAKLDVLLIANNNALIIDWKTGKRRPDFAQLELFALVTLLKYPEVDVVNTAFVWTRDMACDAETFSRAQQQDLLNSLLAKTARVEQSAATNNWPAKPGPLCRYCPARSRCEYAQ